MKSIVICLALCGAAIGRAEPAPLEPLPPQEQVELQPVLGDGQTIATPSDSFTITNTPEIRANVNLEKGLVVLLPAADQKFAMHLQFRADPINGGQLVSEKQMHDAITTVSEPFVKDAEDAKPPFKSIKYAGREGCYAVFTDKRLVGVDQPPDNDYRHAVVGLLRLSEGSVLHFTLFVNDLASPDFFGPLSYAMKFVKPLPATRPVGNSQTAR